MKDVSILTAAGAIVGVAIGLWLPASGEDGWLWSAAGGAAAYGTFGLSGHWLGRVHGQPLGWAVGGPIGLTLGGAIWMVVLLPISNDGAKMIIGAFTGCFAGSICGPLLGAFALYRTIKTGRCTESAEIIATVVMLLVTFLVFGGIPLLVMFQAVCQHN